MESLSFPRMHLSFSSLGPCSELNFWPSQAYPRLTMVPLSWVLAPGVLSPSQVRTNMLAESVNGAGDQLLVSEVGKKPKAGSFTQVILRG